MFCDSNSSVKRFFQRGGKARGAFGFGGGSPGHGFMGGGGMPGARRFSSTDLQLVLLALLEERAAHGYELIKALEERSNGFYVPSPGVIYPALTYLDEIGHASVEQEGNRKLYRVTDEGRKHLESNRDGAQMMLGVLGRIGQRMEQVREAFAGLDEADAGTADEFHRARHGLKSALMRTRGASPAEVRRIVGILDRATAEILDTAKPNHSKHEKQS